MAPRVSKAELQKRTHVRLWQKSDRLHRLLTEVLEPFGLSEPQFNVLRILRGAGSGGLPCKEVGARMVTRVPDVTRLMDRVEKAGWLKRERAQSDRRVVVATITPEGRRLLQRVDPLVEREHARVFAAFSVQQLEVMLDLLGQIPDQEDPGQSDASDR